MRKLLFVFVLLIATFSQKTGMSLRLDQVPSDTDQVYLIVAEGGIAPYTYNAWGLPLGGTLNGNKIILSSKTLPGRYWITIAATDVNGQDVQKRLTLTITAIQQDNGSNTQNFSINNSNLLGQQVSSGLIKNSKTLQNLQSSKTSDSNLSSGSQTVQSISQNNISNVLLSQKIKKNSDNKSNSIASLGSISNIRSVLNSVNSLSDEDITKIMNALSLQRSSNILNSNFNTYLNSYNRPNLQSSPSTSASFSSSNLQNNLLSSSSSSKNAGSTLENSVSKSNSILQNAPIQSITDSSSIPLQPLSSSKSSQSLSLNQRINQILYPPPATLNPPDDLPKYYGNVYPQVDPPTVTLKEINPTAQMILTSQTQPTQATKTNIGPDQILLSTSQRRQNAIAAVTNMIKIVDQAKQNKIQVQNLVNQLNLQLNKALENQKSNQKQIINIQGIVTQINSTIETIKTQIDTLNNQIEDSKKQKQTLEAQRAQMRNQINNFETNKATTTNQYNSANSQVIKAENSITQKRIVCQGVNNQIKKNKQLISNLENQSREYDKKVITFSDNLQKRQNTVDDLQRKLTAAIAERDLAQKDLDLAKAQKRNIPAKIDGIKTNLSNFQQSGLKCQTQVFNLNKIVDSLKMKVITLDVQSNTINGKIKQLKNRMVSLDNTIKGLQETAPKQAERVKDLQNQLNNWRSQLNRKITQRNAKYASGVDANNKVQFAKQNVNEGLKRLKQEDEAIFNATRYLEAARSEQQLSKTAMEQLVHRYAGGPNGALPYSIVPNGGGKTFAGFPRGNNPSGSYLGPIRNDGDGAPGIYAINDWTHYLSQAFGAGVNPAFKGSVNSLYPFSFSSVVVGNQVINPGNIRGNSELCGVSNGQPRSFTGKVEVVRGDSFDLRLDNGQIVIVVVINCTKLYSNRNRYSIRQGDIAVVRGVQNLGAIIGQNILCLS